MLENHTHVVIVFPHPDDESFGAAGLSRRFRKQGTKVTYLCGTLGEMGRNMGTPPFANRETLSKIREQELKAACEFLDIDYRLLGYRDKTIEFEDEDKVAEHVKEVLEELEPSLVITHYPGYAVHPDHNALGKATIEAVRRMDPEKRPVVWAGAIQRHFEKELGEPDIVLPVEDFQHKLDAILHHKSQAEGMLKKMQEPTEENKLYFAELKKRLGKERFFTWEFNDE